jgi:glycosyltransferase involved in cell wall biosynthesis
MAVSLCREKLMLSFPTGSVPRVSIGLPTYSRPVELAQCLRDLSAQTFQDLEIIVSDNASPDPEVERLVRLAAATDPRIRYVRQARNIGPIPNFQAVLAEARGEFFIWAADDDRRAPEFLEELVRILDRDPTAVFAFCNFDTRDCAGNLMPKRQNFLPPMQTMTHPSAFVRQVRFFAIPEGTSKPHPIYGLIRRKALADFSWPRFVERVGWHGADSLFVCWLLGRGRLALSDRKLMTFTVDTVKNYGVPEIASRLGRHISNVWHLLVYAFRHLKVSSSGAAFVIFLLMPLKFGEIVMTHLVRPMLARVQGLLGGLP